MDATLERHGNRYTLRVERQLQGSIDKVWRAVTDPTFLLRWFPCDVTGEWSVGAPLRFEFREGEGGETEERYLRGKVLAVEAPHLLEFSWGPDLLRFELESEGHGCLFRLSHTFDDPAWGARNAAGWEICVENLDLLLQGAALVKLAADVWNTKFRRYVARFRGPYGEQVGPPEDHPILGREDDR